MPFFYCPVCNQKFVNEKDEKEHSKIHQKTVSLQPEEPKTEKLAEPKKEFKIPDFIKKFHHKNVSITLLNGFVITGKLTGFNNYDLMIDEKILVPKHGILMMQEATGKEEIKNIIVMPSNLG